MKNKILILSILFILLSLTGCAECINVEYENVEVVVVNELYYPSWMQPVIYGQTTSYIIHPAQYQITVEYDGERYIFDDEYTYKKYYNKIGQKVNGTLEIRTYDDGTVKYDICALE